MSTDDDGIGGDPGSGEPREPLNQPPDLQDLADSPPVSAGCALVRGQLRDFVDGDLTELQFVAVEEHVHGCRTCGLALARAEHELLRLRRAFVSIARDERIGAKATGQQVVGPRPGFAARVVDRLVLDETSLVSREMLAAARTKAAQTKAAQAQAGTAAAAKPRGTVLTGTVFTGTVFTGTVLTGSLVAAVMLLALLVVGADLWLDSDRQPEPSPRWVVISPGNGFSELGPVTLGQGLANGQTLAVSKDGKVEAAQYDGTAQVQPAATLEWSNSARTQFQNGEPRLLGGTLRAKTSRPVPIPLADGSRIELGIGEYLISIEDEEALRRSRENGSDVSRGEWRNGIEVLSGSAAVIVRPGQPNIVVQAGKIGVYGSQGPVAVLDGPSSVANPTGSGLSRDPAVTETPDAVLRGRVYERSGVPAVGAGVWLWFAGGGIARFGAPIVDANGTFLLPTGPIGSGSVCDLPFAIVQVVPPANRLELGMIAPEAIRLDYMNDGAHLATSPVLDVSAPLIGTVVDDTGASRQGVRVIPCVVDELFHSVLAWPEGQVQTNAQGAFRLSRLPVTLPSHQHLAVLLLHGALVPTVVPVPLRSSFAARTFDARLVAPRLKSVRLEGLPGSATLQVLEDVAGLPPGSAMVRRSVSTDAQGRVANLRVGGGRLWLLRGSSSYHQNVRELVLDALLATPVYRFASSPPVAYESTFLPMQPVFGSDVSLASSFRFERFSAARSIDPGNGISVQVFDALFDRPQLGAQVFAVHTSGPRGVSGSRFLGFTSGAGQLTVALEANEVGLVVVGVDGSSESVAVSPAMRASGDGLNVQLRANGRVVLDSSLRPSSESGQPTVTTIRFDPATPHLNGLRPSVVRFASALDGWVVTDVPPGEYRAMIDGHAYPIDVPPGGSVTLH